MQRLCRPAVVSAAVAAMIVSGCGTEVSGVEVDGVEVSPVEPPPVRAVVDYQIGGAYPPDPEVGVVVRDREAEPAEGVYSVCYINAFQAQPHESALWEELRPDLLLRDDSGQVVRDVEWDEPLLDISTAAAREALTDVVGEWMADCAARGFRAVEPDNLDSWSRSGGRATREDAVAYAALLVERAHSLGLAIAQKNAAELTDEEIGRIGFDFAVAEDCQHYSWGEGSECDRYLAAYGDRVIEIEYTDGGRWAFLTACRERGDRISVLLRDRDVTPRGEPGYVNRPCRPRG